MEITPVAKEVRVKYTMLRHNINAPVLIEDPGPTGTNRATDNVGNLLGDLWHRRERLAIGAAVGAALGLALWGITPWEYAANATLLVSPAGGGEASDTSAETPVTAETMRTQAGLLQSTPNLLASVDRLGLADIDMYTEGSKPSMFGWLSSPPKTPRGAAVFEVAKRFGVGASGQDYLIHLSYTDKDPHRAEQILDSLVKGYFSARLDQSGAMADETLLVLDRQAERLRGKAQEAAAAASAFRQKYDLPNLRLGSTEEQEIAALAQPLADMRAERARLVAALDGGNDASYAQLEEIRNSPAIQQLQTIEVDLLAKEASVSVAGRRDNNDTRETEAQLARVQEMIVATTAEIVSGLRERRAALDKGIAELQRLIQDRRTNVRETDANRVELQRLEEAADAAQKIYLSYSLRATELSVGGHATFDRVIVAALPQASEQPEKRGASLYAVGGGFLGTIGAAMSIAAASVWNRKVRNRDDVLRAGRVVDCFTLPFIPTLTRKGASVTAYVSDAPASAFAETIRGLMARVMALSGGGRPATLLVTSPEWGHGRTTATLALASVAASDGLKVLLVEADMRRPQLGTRLGPSRAGTEAVLSGSVPLRDAISRHALGFDYLTVHRPLVPGPDLLGLSRLLEATNATPGHWDILVIDTPPLLAVSDGLQMAANVPLCLLVATAGKTDTEVLTKALDRLAPNRTLKVFGLVLAGSARGRRSNDSPDYSGS